jgi:stress response protein YsnF
MEDETTPPLQLIEETASVRAESAVTGRVRVSTHTEIHEEIARATLAGETVEVTRVPVDRQVASAPEVRTEGDVTIVPVVEEMLFVERRLVLREEIHIRRRPTETVVETPVELRRQRATVERVLADGQDPHELEPD